MIGTRSFMAKGEEVEHKWYKMCIRDRYKGASHAEMTVFDTKESHREDC